MSVFAFVFFNMFILLGIKRGEFCDPVFLFFEFYLLFVVKYAYSLIRCHSNPNYTMDVRLLRESRVTSFLFQTRHLGLLNFHFSVVEITLFINNLESSPFLK